MLAPFLRAPGERREIRRADVRFGRQLGRVSARGGNCDLT